MKLACATIQKLHLWKFPGPSKDLIEHLKGPAKAEAILTTDYAKRPKDRALQHFWDIIDAYENKVTAVTMLHSHNLTLAMDYLNTVFNHDGNAIRVEI